MMNCDISKYQGDVIGLEVPINTYEHLEEGGGPVGTTYLSIATRTPLVGRTNPKNRIVGSNERVRRSELLSDFCPEPHNYFILAYSIGRFDRDLRPVSSKVRLTSTYLFSPHPKN